MILRKLSHSIIQEKQSPRLLVSIMIISQNETQNNNNGNTLEENSTSSVELLACPMKRIIRIRYSIQTDLTTSQLFRKPSATFEIGGEEQEKNLLDEKP